MASVEEMQNKLNSLTSDSPINLNFIPNENIIIQNVMKDTMKRDLKPQEVEQIKNSFTGAMIKKEVQDLKSNISSFMKVVPSMGASIATQVGAAAAAPTSLPAVPSIISGIKSQLDVLNSQAVQILSSCVFLKIEVPDAFIAAITTISLIKTALDAIPV